MSMRTVIAIAAIAACLAGALRAPAAQPPALPPGTVGYLWVPSPEKLFADADSFLGALGTPNAGLMFVKSLLGQMLSNPDLSAVDMKGPLLLVMLNPKENPQPLAAAFRIGQLDAYLKGLEEPPILKPSDAASGVKVYARKVQTFDSAAYDAASIDEQSDVNRFYKTSEEPFLAIRGDTAWVSENPDLLGRLQNLAPEALSPGLGHNLVLVFEAETLGKLLREEADKQLQVIDESAGADASAKMLHAQVDLYLGYLAQVRRAELGITLDKAGAAVEKSVTARPGTTLAAFLAAQKKGELKLARFLDRDSWLAADFRVSRPELLMGFYSRMFDLMYQSPPLAGAAPDPKARSSYLQAIKAMVDTMGEEEAFCISSPPGTFFSGVSVMEIKSEAGWKNYIRQGVLDVIPAWKGSAAGKGMTYDTSGIEKPAKYKDIDVYTLRVRVDPGALSIPPEALKTVGSWMSQTMTVAMAAVGKIGVSAMSWGGESRIGEIVDRVSSAQASFEASRFGPSAGSANGVIFLSLDSFLRGIMGLLPADQVKGEAGETLKKIAALDLPLVATIRAEGETLRAGSAFPMEKILAVKKLFESKPKAAGPAPQKPAEGEAK